jgi:hypothetical protein
MMASDEILAYRTVSLVVVCRQRQQTVDFADDIEGPLRPAACPADEVVCASVYDRNTFLRKSGDKEKQIMMKTTELAGVLLCVALLATGCGSPSAPADRSQAAAPAAQPQPAPTGTAASPEPAETPAAAPTEQASSDTSPVEATAVQAEAPPPAPAVAPAPTPPVAKAPAAAPVPAPAAAPAPAPVAAAPPPAETAAKAPAVAAAPTPAVVDKGGLVAVAATKPGLSRVGSDSCEMCHDVQFASWSTTAHAARNPPLDCEGCHGPGSEYSKMAVMKDPAKARAAGLVIPTGAFCSNCHMKGVTDDFLKKAHAHEE